MELPLSSRWLQSIREEVGGGGTERGIRPCRAQVSSLPPGGSAQTWAVDFLPAPLGSHPRSRCQVQGQEALPGFPLGLIRSGSELLSLYGAG